VQAQQLWFRTYQAEEILLDLPVLTLELLSNKQFMFHLYSLTTSKNHTFECILLSVSPMA